MQASTSTIAKFPRSFNVERSERGEIVKEKVVYSEFQACGEPFAGLGTVGDIYIDITYKNCALYAKFEGGWKKWPGPTQRTTALRHPVHLTHVLWCKLDKKLLGWVLAKSLSRILISSASQVISTILDFRRSVLQKHVKKQSKNDTLPSLAKKPRLEELSPSSAQVTDPVRNSPVNYWFSFPPFVDSIVTFIDKSEFPEMDICARDPEPQSDAHFNATREARRSSKLIVTQNKPTNELQELDDDFMAESQRIMNAIMSSTKGCPGGASVTEAFMHGNPPQHEGTDKELTAIETQLPNPPLVEPPVPRVPSPSCPQTQSRRLNSLGTSSMLSESGLVISLANPEPPRISPTPKVQSPTQLPSSPVLATKKPRIPSIARKRSSWAMSDDDEVHRVDASSSAPQIKPIPTLGDDLEYPKTVSSSSLSTPVSLRKKRLSAARKMPSPPKLHVSFSSKDKGKAKASDVSSTSSAPISAKEERSPSAMQPESPLAPQERSSHGWKRSQRLPPSGLNSPSTTASTSIPPSRFAVQHSKSDLTAAASKHVPLVSVQKLAPLNSLDALSSPSSPSTKSFARKGKAMYAGTATANIQAVRKRSLSPMNVEVAEETDNRASANIKLEKGTSSPSPAARPLERKKLQKATTSVSAPVALANKGRGKSPVSSVSARGYQKRSRVATDKGVVDLTGADSDNDEVIEINADRKVEKSSSVIISPTKFKVKGRGLPISSTQTVKVMPKHKRPPEYKRKAAIDREAMARQQLKNELNMKSVIDLTSASDEDEDNQINLKPLLLAKKAAQSGDEVEKQGISAVKEEEDVFGDIEMVDLPAPSRNDVEEIGAELGDDVDMSNSNDLDEGKGMGGDELNKDKDDKNGYGDGERDLPIGVEDAQEDGRNHGSPQQADDVVESGVEPVSHYDHESGAEEGGRCVEKNGPNKETHWNSVDETQQQPAVDNGEDDSALVYCGEPGFGEVARRGESARDDCKYHDNLFEAQAGKADIRAEKKEFSGERDEEMKDLVPPLAHLPEPESDSENDTETESSQTAMEDVVDELNDEDDESEHEFEDGKDRVDVPSDLRLTDAHLRLLFDLDGKRYCRACLSQEPTVYWQVPPGSVELVLGQLMQHSISVHLQICEQFAALDQDELREIERTVM